MIDRLVKEYTERADHSKKVASDILAIISQGCVPTEDVVDNLDECILALREKYSEIVQIAERDASGEDFPLPGSPVDEYVTVIKNSAYAQRNQLLEASKDTLEKFISVRSLIEIYSNALLPYQEGARRMLAQIIDDSILDLETVQTETAGPKSFLEAIACEDFDTEDSYEKLEKASHHYSQRVQSGISMKRYYLPSESENPVEDHNSDMVNSTVETSGALSHTDDASQSMESFESVELREETSNNAQTEELQRIQPEEEHASEDISSDGMKLEHQLSEAAQNLIRKGILFVPDSDDSEMSIMANSSAEAKKISASVFVNDIKQNPPKAFKEVLSFAVIYGCVSEEVLKATGMPDSLVSFSLSDLLKKGYLRKVSFAPDATFYVPSPRLYKAITYKEARKYLGLSAGNMDKEASKEDLSYSAAITRYVFLRQYVAAKDSVDTECTSKQYSTTSSNSDTAFCFVMYDKDRTSPFTCVLGAFWNNEEACNYGFEVMCNHIRESQGTKNLMIVAATKDRAQNLAQSLIESIDKGLPETVISLYSYLDQEYYDYYSGQVIDQEAAYATKRVCDEENTTEDEEKQPVIETNDIVAEEQIGKTEHREARTPEQTKSLRSGSAAYESQEIGMPKEHPSDQNTNNNLQDEEELSAEPITHQEPGIIVSEESVRNTVYDMVYSGRLYAATAYARACSEMSEGHRKLSKALSYAVNDPAERCTYSAENVFDMISERDPFDDALILSTACRTFFSNQVSFDYQIKALHNAVKEYEWLHQITPFGNVLYSLVEFKDNQKKGMDAYADYRAKTQKQLEEEIASLQRAAASFYENTIAGKTIVNVPHRQFLETKKSIFSIDGYFGMYFRFILDGDRSIESDLAEFLQKEFLKDGSNLSEESISEEKLWAYIVRFWEQAGETVNAKRKDDLKSRLRSNITATTRNAVQLLVQWCVLIEQTKTVAVDEGQTAYKKIKPSLVEELSSAIEYLDSRIAGSFETKEAACFVIIRETLRELLGCIDGSFSESGRKYFYVPFLLTDDVLLEDDYLPDLDNHDNIIAILSPQDRILEHVKKRNAEDSTYRQRLHEIMNEGGDDYGTARLLVKYLHEIGQIDDTEKLTETILEAINYAKETAKNRRTDFSGDLELAQVYGQIDNSVEDKKERILQIVDEQFELAVDTSNYGFFYKVLESYLVEIRKEAKAKEPEFLEQLNAFRTTAIPGLTQEEKDRRIRSIQQAIQDQNYTVAEDLLAHMTSVEEADVWDEEEYLQDFLDNYEFHYSSVSGIRKSFSSLASTHTRNKEERGGQQLVDNWLPGGSDLGQERLKRLLSGLGFSIDSIKPQAKINGKYENFIVTVAGAAGSQRDDLIHPIAAFGSGAAQDGFRVVCIYGSYEADRLIEIMKQIGNTKHTLLLHDYALSLPERRRLARKAKTSLSDKFFGVVDRTVMMYLVRNYDITRINRMLVSLVMPFGYYQPYVWDSAKLMPPEIFIGRKRELERIKSPSGVNVVYGGRQLGKSALLKKVRADIDHNENGDRAVYIDIKDKDYKATAIKVGQELYDSGILTVEPQTDDWGELSRAIRNRLKSQNDYIPYLLLLLDEADVFIESCESVNYSPLDALKEIQNVGTNRFKFVVAGLRDVVRFKREAALGNNSVLAHLQSMTVTPFSASEAKALIKKPLHYLGLRFPKEKEMLVSLILASTNYFPGLIQLYCSKLLEAMRKADYAGYNESNAPIYEVSENHIKKILADSNFMDEVREKFSITLRLGGDDYYFIIALIMAYLYHENGYRNGYASSEILDVANEFDIAKISSLDVNRVEALMEELKELNVLRKVGEKGYLFSRVAFYQMMGTRNDVETKLMDYMEG